MNEIPKLCVICTSSRDRGVVIRVLGREKGREKQQDFSRCFCRCDLRLDLRPVVEPNNRPLVIINRDALHQDAEGYGIELLGALRQAA